MVNFFFFKSSGTNFNRITKVLQMLSHKHFLTFFFICSYACPENDTISPWSFSISHLMLLFMPFEKLSLSAEGYESQKQWLIAVFPVLFSRAVYECYDKSSVDRICNIAVECIFHPCKQLCWPKCQVNCCMKTLVCKELVVLLYQVMAAMYVGIVTSLSHRKYIHRK